MANYVKGEGVPDFVLLNDITEDAMVENINTRYGKDIIYTYIGDVVVSINPYKQLPIYSTAIIDRYRGKYMYEEAPHIYALSNNAYRNMLANSDNQCIIISGESGAGKTEASKVIMQYISAVSKSSQDVDRVKKQLLDSNPVLEAFGNAKTLRNDNSSRFGKYMEIQFDKSGAPKGGCINNYLLEKSRVVTRATGERSFHIFYQLLAGSSENELQSLFSFKDPNNYQYLSSSKCITVDSVDDSKDFKIVKAAMSILGFTDEMKSSVWKILAAILHIGNVKFEQEPGGGGGAVQHKMKITDSRVVRVAASLLDCDERTLNNALTHRSISTGVGRRMSIINVALDDAQAVYTRDALSKALFSRLFNWIVTKINKSIHSDNTTGQLVIGVLDIYGFEIFENNSFEQFCINLCNEKLQQLFIELTLKSEQDEYVREGVKWTPVQYFNNKIICDLIEGRPVGFLSLLDEQCLIANSTDQGFLEKLNHHFGKHHHYQSYTTSNDRTIPNGAFRLRHYAGDVTYKIEGFLNKNRDTLFTDLIAAMQSSTNPTILELFPDVLADSKKRPVTAGFQFKNSLNALIDTLLKCTPHYIRCIKPNSNKKPGVLEDSLLRHQIRYLGLVENVRVRRAGFAYRQTYDRFYRRYKMLCPATWPRWPGDARSGTDKIIAHFNLSEQEYCHGKTKIFIKNPNTLFSLEEKRATYLPGIVTKMQALYRGWCARKDWGLRKAAIVIQLYYRKYRARKYVLQVKSAFSNVSTDPKFGRDVVWPQPAFVLRRAFTLLKKVHQTWRAHKIIKTLGSAEKEAVMRQKVAAYDIFKGKKPWDFARKFEADYLEKDTNPTKMKYQQQMQNLFSTYGDTQVLFADYADKINPRGKAQRRGIVITNNSIYKHDPRTYNVKKFGTPISKVSSVTLSPFSDTFVFVHCKDGLRDLVLNLGVARCERVSEFVTVLSTQFQNLTNTKLPVHFSEKITFNNTRTKVKTGSDGTVVFEASTEARYQIPTFVKGKNNSHTIHYLRT